MKKILVIQTAFLGDVILATSLLEKLHSCFPESKVSILVREGNEGLFRDHPFLSDVLVWKKKKGKWSNLISVLQQVRKHKYDAVFNLQRFFASGFLTVFSGAKVRAGFDKNPLSLLFTKVTTHTIGDGSHETERNNKLLEDFCEGKSSLPKLYPSAKDDAATASWKNKKYVTMAPASVWFTKQLPENKWIEMIGIADPGLMIYLLGAPGDAAMCENIRNATDPSRVVNLAGKLNFLESASLMRDAVMNYVNDSGPLHIASAMNAPVTAFFLSTVPAYGFGPLSDKSLIVQTTEPLDCKPCGLHGWQSCPMEHFRCALTIKVPAPGK